MASQRKSYQQLDAEIQALIAKKNALLEGSAELLCKSILTKEVKAKIAELTNDDIRAVGKKVAASIDDIVKSVRKQADAKGAPRPHPANVAPKDDVQKHKIDLKNAVLEPVSGARTLGASSAGMGAAERHQY